jgi:hypothetical protein
VGPDDVTVRQLLGHLAGQPLRYAALGVVMGGDRRRRADVRQTIGQSSPMFDLSRPASPLGGAWRESGMTLVNARRRGGAAVSIKQGAQARLASLPAQQTSEARPASESPSPARAPPIAGAAPHPPSSRWPFRSTRPRRRGRGPAQDRRKELHAHRHVDAHKLLKFAGPRLWPLLLLLNLLLDVGLAVGRQQPRDLQRVRACELHECTTVQSWSRL